MKFSDEVNEEKEMIKYQVRIKKQLRKLEKSKDFKGAVAKELKEYGWDPDILEDFLYRKRKGALDVYNKISDTGLKSFNFDDLNNVIPELYKQLFLMEGVNKDYSDLTGRTSDFYKQGEKFINNILSSLTLELELRKLNGDFR